MKTYVIVEVPDDEILQLAPGISSVAAISEIDLTRIRAALWAASDLWWSAAQDEGAAMSVNVEDRQAALQALVWAKEAEAALVKLGHKWLREHFSSDEEYAAGREKSFENGLAAELSLEHINVVRERLGADVARQAEKKLDKKEN